MSDIRNVGEVLSAANAELKAKLRDSAALVEELAEACKHLCWALRESSSDRGLIVPHGDALDEGLRMEEKVAAFRHGKSIVKELQAEALRERAGNLEQFAQEKGRLAGAYGNSHELSVADGIEYAVGDLRRWADELSPPDKGDARE